MTHFIIDFVVGGVLPSTLSIVAEAADFMCSPSYEGPNWEHMILLRSPDCFAVVLDPLRSPTSTRVPGRSAIDLPFIWRLSRALERSDATLAQSEQSGYQVAFASLMSFRRRPVFILFHGHGWSGRRNRAFAAVVRQMNWVHILCLSGALRDLVVAEYGFPQHRVHVTGYGVDDRYFSPVPPIGGQYIVSAGTASRDYRTLATACAGISATVRVAADSNWYAESLNLKESEIPSNMLVASAGSYDALRTLYANALFVVVPLINVRYACGYAVIAEAMAMGKAVIATRTESPSDLIEHGVNGLYVPPNDATALHAAIQDLLTHPEKAIEMGNSGRRNIETGGNLDSYVSRIMNVIRDSTNLSARTKFASSSR